MAMTIQDRLRRMLGERIPVGGSDTDTFFSNEEIDDLLAENGSDLNAAALQGWLEKAAEFAKLIDRKASGDTVKLSDMHDNAMAMVDHYGKAVGVAAEAIIGRVVGRPINLRENTYGGLQPHDTVGEVHTASSSPRSETLSFRARQILANSHPDTTEVDPTYPTKGPEPT